MSIVTINDEYLTNIGNAIRAKNGTTDTYKPKEMAAAIRALNVTESNASSFTDYLEGASSIVIPAECTAINCNLTGTDSFKHISVAEGSLLTSLGDNAFSLFGYTYNGCVLDLSNATQMTTLNARAISSHGDNVEIILPPNIETIERYFYVSKGPTTITFTGTPTTFPQNYLVNFSSNGGVGAYDPDTSNNITINVPWDPTVYVPVVYSSGDREANVTVNFNYVAE